MTSKFAQVIALTLLFNVYGCSNESHLFMNKEELAEVSKNESALLGTWIVENNSEVILAIEMEEQVLVLNTPTGNLNIQSLKSMGELGFVLDVGKKNSPEKIMAKFKTYERIEMILMNSQGIELGLKSDLPVTLTKIKEETVITASSSNQ